MLSILWWVWILYMAIYGAGALVLGGALAWKWASHPKRRRVPPPPVPKTTAPVRANYAEPPEASRPRVLERTP